MAEYRSLTVTMIAVTMVPYTTVPYTMVPYTAVMWLTPWFGTIPVGTVWSTGVVLTGTGVVYAKPTHGVTHADP